MRVVVQRVTEAGVTIDGVSVAAIDRGLLVLVGVESGDTPADATWLAGKIAGLRIFADDAGRMNLGVRDVGGDVLVVSQFTLHASTERGNRPGFTRAAKPEEAIPLYEAFLADVEREIGRRAERGIFATDMQVRLVNDGPVTILIDSRRRE